MWVTAEYEATSLFSLKSSLATSSAGKTLLVPTPFSLKMALLDVAIRTRGLSQGKMDFDWIRALNIAISPAPRAVVTNLFAKIQKPRRTDKAKSGSGNEAESEVETTFEDEDKGPFGPTIAYREYVHLQGRIGVAFEVPPSLLLTENLTTLSNLILGLNYLGKRGGFFQLVTIPFQTEELSSGYHHVTSETPPVFLGGLLQTLDDCGPELTFDKADIYSDKKIRPGKDRILRSVVLPYELIRSSRTYSYYKIIDESQV